MPKRETSVARPKHVRKSSVSWRPSRDGSATSLGRDRSPSSLKVALKPKDRENHTHILGSTGTGKSKLLEYMLRQDILNRKAGLCLLDPHGTLYDEILLFASHRYPNLADRIVTFQPARDIDHVVGFNPVSTDMSRMDYFLENLISACLKAWGQHNSDSSPRIARWLENIFYTIMSNDMTMLETVPLTSTARNDGKREKMLGRLSSDAVLSDWDSYNQATLTQRQTMMEGASNRLRKFLRNEAVRLILGQQKHRLDFHKIMQEGKILLVNLNGEDKIDRQNMQLIGTLMVNEIFSAAQLRDPRDASLKPFYFYIDEFAQFITRDIAYSLEEARKRKLFMVLAHQHLAQLKKEDEYLYASVMTNCKNKIIFGGLSVEDSDIMTRELQTGFLDLKSLKHEQYRTRVRQVEETREVRSYNTGSSEARSETLSQSDTQTHSESQSETHGESTSHTHGRSKTLSVGETQTRGTSGSIVKGVVRGVTETVGLSKTLGKQISENWSEAQNQSRSDTWGKSDTQGRSDTSGTSRSRSHGEGENWSSSQSDGWSSSETHGHSSQHSSGNSRNQSHTTRDGDHHSFSSGQGTSESSSYGNSHSSSSGRSGSRSHSQGGNRFQSVSEGEQQSSSLSSSQSNSVGGSTSHGQTQSHGHGEAQSSSEQQSRSDGLSRSYSQSQNKGWSQSHAKSITQSEGMSESVGHTDSSSTTTGTSQSSAHTEGRATGNTQTESHGESVSYVPFLRPEEVQELASVNFWTKEELMFMKQGELKHQETAHAFVKIGAGAPVACQVDHVESVYYHEKTAAKKLQRFRERMIAAHPEYFLTLEDARRECVQRQVEFFGEPIRFDGEAPSYTKQDSSDAEDDFFE